jgi:N-acetylmuramoyl-L-alanine amidase
MNIFDQEIAARTGMGEARGEGEQAMQAVMWTGVNRFTAKRWYSLQTLAATFLKYEQYDCWMPKDPNFSYITAITPSIGLFAQALQWAEGVIKGTIPDPTQGATHYHDSSITPPEWTKGATKTKAIGRLTFYKDVA